MSLFMSMIGVGLVTSIHCVFMCGGLVLTYAVKGAEDGPWYRRLMPHLAYQGAKIVSYAAVALILGGLVSLVGRALDITAFRSWLQVAAGIYMVLLGLSMTGKFPMLMKIAPRPPKFLIDALSRNRKKAAADAADGTTSLATPVSFGLLTGLMPCAPLIAAQASAVATGSPALGALAMVGFGIGTMPLMLAFGFASSMLSKQFQQKMQVFAAGAVLVFGLVIFNRGLMLVGSPVTFETVRTAVLGGGPAPATDTEYKTGADGVVEVPLTIKNVRFEPASLAIPADKPVRLVVDRQEQNACSDQLAIPQLGILVDLKPNAVTTIDVPASKAGNYTLTCGMGMMAGAISVGGGASGGSGPSPLLAPVLVVLAALGGWWFFLRRQAGREVEPAPGGKGAPAPGPGGRRLQPVPVPAGRRGAPATARSGVLFGFEVPELIVAAGAIASAVLLGLGLGGYFG